MSRIGRAWQYIKTCWNGNEAEHDVCIDQYPKGTVVIGIGGSTKLSANVTTTAPEPFIKWQKVTGSESINLQTDSIKYSGSSCAMPTPELVINDVDQTDDGVYHLSVTTVSGTVIGPKVLLNVFGDAVDSLSKEKINYLRYYLLCQTIATESVRLYFTRKIPEPTLSSHLNSNKPNLRFSYWKCTSDQLTVLFPVAPGIAKSGNFDFTLLYKLIRHTITPGSTPTRGWGQNPLPNDIREEDDIERIRHNRNLLAHNIEFKLNDSDFNNLWTDLSQVNG
ncbi:E3 ubiquitin-protein ligase DZIP3-like [Mytilus edulis]|uniref:E3 ubiquitin-protein ligase DZIP3-like n=1 Tax=Mytilus edulis TaxID=6550 RepID=UPI0039EEBFFC